MKKVEVVAAVIVHQGEILCVQKAESKIPWLSLKFEFPGGKPEPGESQEEALIREIREELCMEIIPRKHLISVGHCYPETEVLLHAWFCTCSSRELELREHSKAVWMKREQLHEPEWAAADLPVVEFIQKATSMPVF